MINENNLDQDIHGNPVLISSSGREKRSASREPFVPDFWPGEEPSPNLPWNPAGPDR